MRIAVSGSHGLIGSALVSSLASEGIEVLRLVHSPSPRQGVANSPGVSNAGQVEWDSQAGQWNAEPLEGVDAVVHLAGESIAQRWTEKAKASIRSSRIQGTSLLSRSLAGLKKPPVVLVCGSAIGYYGDRGVQVLTEDSSPGTGFLAEVCREWEQAADPAVQRGIRVAFLRTGIVLARDGGALKKMLPPFRMGVGGTLGAGSQYMSWIALDDEVAAIRHILSTEALKGPVNAVAPSAITNQQFTKILGKVLDRPTVLPMPAFAIKLLFGQMGVEALLGSARVEPARLNATGFRFRYSNLEQAIRHVLLDETAGPNRPKAG